MQGLRGFFSVFLPAKESRHYDFAITFLPNNPANKMKQSCFLLVPEQVCQILVLFLLNCLYQDSVYISECPYWKNLSDIIFCFVNQLHFDLLNGIYCFLLPILVLLVSFSFKILLLALLRERGAWYFILMFNE